PVADEDRRHPAPERLDDAEVPLEHVDAEAGPVLRQPGEEIAQAVWPFQRLPLRLELDPHVEIPADEHDALPGAEHRGFRMAEIGGRVDDEGKALRRLDAPARPARYEHAVG